MATHLRINKPAVTRSMDRLIMVDANRQEEDSQDRRSVIAVCTEAGVKMVKRHKAALEAASIGAD